MAIATTDTGLGRHRRLTRAGFEATEYRRPLRERADSRYNIGMAEHRITVHPSLPLEVNAADLLIEVMSDGAKLGELRVSRGSIDWAPRNHSYAASLSWERFDALMREQFS